MLLVAGTGREGEHDRSYGRMQIGARARPLCSGSKDSSLERRSAVYAYAGSGIIIPSDKPLSRRERTFSDRYRARSESATGRQRPFRRKVGSTFNGPRRFSQ